jgi:hypothetical protein
MSTMLIWPPVVGSLSNGVPDGVRMNDGPDTTVEDVSSIVILTDPA